MEKKYSPIDWENLTFSFRETDRMYISNCKQGEEWRIGKMQDFQNLSISPAAGVLNYGQGLFEGMKAYRSIDGSVVLFRPKENAKRMQMGARRLGMPEVPEDIFIDAVIKSVQENSRWIPPAGKGTLYIRPLLMGSGPILGVSPAPEYTFLVYVSPVGPYFKGGLKPTSLKISENHHRAAPGGSGGVKAIGNYAPGMVPSMNAKSEGFAEIIYLDAVNHKYIEEVGAANFFCIKNGVISTPELTGTILGGITRLSIIELARSKGYEVREEKIDVEYALTADECFCAGTAAVVSSIGSIKHGDTVVEFCNGGVGEITRDIYDSLISIQNRKSEDIFGWMMEIDV
ncbi:MAG: branched-chain amino acid aminotransferase [Candidatus Thalassarchaeaceae archaeon]|nr:branched-chain amino acid aminotransferase [Candidatus Thalassarchaeaceae archaeon]